MDHGTDGALAARLLPTKLFTPTLDPDVVERGRLLQELNSARGGRLLLVSAPAGSGKTTLITAWLRQLDRPAGWVSLDSGDDDPLSFLGYVVEGFRSMGQGGCERTRALSGSGSAPAPRVVAMSLVAELTASAAAGVLVLDDYHVITDPAVHELLAWLLERAPPSVTFVVASRSDPPLPLARMRARGQLLEVRESDLRFDLVEATDLLGRLCHKTLRPESVAMLAARTEGWAVGLQLAGLALRRSDDPDAFVRAFTGTHTYIADYLADEVLAGVPEEHQQFLIRTAVLTRLTGALCDAALERTGSQALLEALSRANLFLVPLDGDRRWFRYHHLFGDLLRRRGRDHAASGVEHRAVLGRASAWCEDAGATDDAVGYAVQAGDITRAAGLVARHGIEVLAAGEGATALRWIRALPDDMVRSSPDHCVIAGWGHALVESYGRSSSDYADTAVQMLNAERRAYPCVEDVGLHARVIAAGGHEGGDLDAVLRSLEDARDSTQEGNLPLRSATEIMIGEIHRQLGRYTSGLAAQDRASAIGMRAGSTILQLSAVTAGALIRLLQGRLCETIATVDTALAGRTSLRESLGTQVGNLCAIRAAAHFERNDLDLAERDLRQAWTALGVPDGAADDWSSIVPVGLARPGAFHTNVHAVLCGFTTQVRLLIRRGDTEAALRHLDAVELSMPRSTGPSDRIVIDALRVRAWAAAGRRTPLHRWLRLPQARSSGVAHWDHVVRATRARASLAAGDPATARAALAPLLDGSPHGEEDIAHAEALVLGAGAAAAMGGGGQGEAIRLVGAALERTAAGRRAAPWLEVGVAVVPLLQSAIRNGGASAAALTHAATLLGLLRREAGAAPARGPDALSDREVTVLRLMAAGHTNQQIADTLCLAVGSIKKHTHNIFGKLGVSNRTQAARTAREEGLLR